MKGSQGLGEHIFNYMIYPHAGDWDTGGVMKEADRFNLPLEPAQVGTHEGDLPKLYSFMQIEPEDILISTLKKAEESENLILRVYNPTGRDLNCRINFYKAPVDSHFVNLNEEAIPEEKPKIEGKVVSFLAKAKKIYTIELSFNL
jgi:alpha-mannosidase